MSRLIAVSNRVPSISAESGSGGLATALKSALEETGGLWFGWSGEVVAAPDPQPHIEWGNGFALATIDLTPAEFEGFYAQCANRALWPLFHGRLDLGSFDHDCYAGYRQVNRRFAEALHPLLEAGDTIWVHDYHLFPLGNELRRQGVDGRLGFFLHIPFPAPEVFAALPWHRELLDDLCAFDVVGFQTTACVRNFNDALERLGGRTAGTHRPRAEAYPIGIDTGAFAKLAAGRSVERMTERLLACRHDQTWIAGVERLDYTKGLAERFLAIEALLERAPELEGRVSLVQIAAPSRESVAEYQDMQAALEALSGRINARFSAIDWTPIRYLNRTFKHARLAALYRTARVGLVTPLRDGMNLVAKEYVAAQDPEDPGVLVLSRFAGAAEELTDAVLVNPYDTSAVVDALHTALQMPLDERQARWQRMMRHLEANDVHRWRRRVLDDLAASEKTADRRSLAA